MFSPFMWSRTYQRHLCAFGDVIFVHKLAILCSCLCSALIWLRFADAHECGASPAFKLLTVDDLEQNHEGKTY